MKITFKFIALASLLFINSFNAQGVEVPEFVIEGVQKVSMPKIQKKKLEFIKPLGGEYFMRKFSPEEFDVSFVSNTDTNVAVPFLRGENYSGKAKLAAGINTLPEGSVFISRSADKYIFTLSGKGRSVSSYEPYSAFLRSGGKLNLRYYPGEAENGLPHMMIGLNGGANYYDGKFWASESPYLQRKALLANGGAELNRYWKDKYAFAVKLSGDYLNLLKENVRERKLSAEGLAAYKLSVFKLKFQGGYVLQSLLSPAYKKFRYYYGFLGSEVKMGKNVTVDFGANFAYFEDEKFFFPALGLKLALGKYFLLSGKVSGSTQFRTNYDFAKENPYYNSAAFENVYSTVSNKINVAARFNYYDYLTAEVSAYYAVNDGYAYYDDFAAKGVFDVKTVDDVAVFALDFSADLFYGKFGYFSLKTKLRNARLTDGNVAPYSPGINVQTRYGYAFPFGFAFTVGADYFSHFYADVENSRKIEAYVNLFAEAEYKIYNKVKIFAKANNILNKNNYFFPGYKNVPFDILIGAEYFWK